MKKITLFITALFCSVLITACGGGGGSDSASVTPPTNPTPDQAAKLVIDNGRGTVNNQDTENKVEVDDKAKNK